MVRITENQTHRFCKGGGRTSYGNNIDYANKIDNDRFINSDVLSMQGQRGIIRILEKWNRPGLIMKKKVRPWFLGLAVCPSVPVFPTQFECVLFHPMLTALDTNIIWPIRVSITIG